MELELSEVKKRILLLKHDIRDQELELLRQKREVERLEKMLSILEQRDTQPKNFDVRQYPLTPDECFTVTTTTTETKTENNVPESPWISVQDALPTIKGDVFVRDKYGYHSVWSSSLVPPDGIITHWMPIPE
jgi:hypothetical protein